MSDNMADTLYDGASRLDDINADFRATPKFAMKQRPEPTRTATKVAVLLPADYGGGTLRGAINLAIQIADGAKATGDQLVVEFGYVDGKNSAPHGAFAELRERGIPYRTMIVTSLPQMHLSLVDKSRTPEHFEAEPSILVFNDGVSNFDDADYRIIVSDRLIGGVASPTSPFAIVAYDFIQRYVPEIFDSGDPALTWRTCTAMMRSYQYADCVIVTSSQAASDANAYAGVPRARLVQVPMSFDPLELADTVSAPITDKRLENGYIVWTTNATPHKNHRTVLKGLTTFYSKNPGAPPSVITGVFTEHFARAIPGDPVSEVPYVKEIRDLIANNFSLRRKLIVKGNLSDSDYSSLLKSATALLHGAIFDNGTFSVVEAAWHGVPAISSRYRAMEELSEAFELTPTYFDATDADSLADMLELALRNLTSLKNALPTREQLRQHSRDAKGPAVWALLRPRVLSGPPMTDLGPSDSMSCSRSGRQRLDRQKDSSYFLPTSSRD